MPQLGLEVSEGTVVELLVSIGSWVEKDATLVVLATDKADTDVVAPVAGIVHSIGVEVGQSVNVGDTLLELADDAAEPGEEPLHSAAPNRVTSRKTGTTVHSDETDRRKIRAAPVARRAAADLGLALEEISGSGPNGRITLNDVREAAASQAGAGVPAIRPGGQTYSADGEELSPLRRAIARRMAASQHDIPQFHIERDVDARHLLATKDAQAASGTHESNRPSVSLNDLLIQALAHTVVEHELLREHYVEPEDGAPRLTRVTSIDIGLAVATDAGLLVPVIRNADQQSLRELASERARLVAAARIGKLDLSEMSGGAITLSNLGLHGVDRFAALVNPGQSAILAVGRLVERVVPRGRSLHVIPTLSLTLTCDHRVIDGAVGAHALQTLAEQLEGEMAWRP